MMVPARKERLVGIIAFASLMQVLLPIAPSRAELRKIKVGDRMPEFSLPDPNGAEFAYKHDRRRVIAIAFLPAAPRRLERTIIDIEKVVRNLQEKAEPLDFVGVISGPAGKDFLKSRKPDSKLVFPILLDSKHQLWGRLGIIAAPTVLIVGKDDRILWIKAGYGYDFVPVVRAYLNQALGIAQETTPEDAGKVRTVANDTIAARVKRHLQMAKILEQKGRLESAIAEVRKAEELDPNSVEPALELGELFCRAGKGQAALDTVAKIRASKLVEKARSLLISGWAQRQMGDLEKAEKDLLEATKLDAKSGRGFFELGQVYQAKGDKDKAIAAYHMALTLVFGGR